MPTTDQFARELRVLGKDISWIDGVWHFSDEMIMPWSEIQNTGKHIDLVTNHLIRMYRNRAA